jgi:Spy/CpxP family protein refolding chaperone
MNFLTKNRLAVISIIILVILNLFTLSALWFQRFGENHKPPPHHFEMNKQGNGEEFLENELELTEEQAKQFEELRLKHFEKTKILMDEIHRYKKEITDELFSSTPDTNKVNLLSEEIGKNEAELERLSFSHFMKLKSVCQPEQKEKFERLFHVIFEDVKPKGPPPPGSGNHPPKGPPPKDPHSKGPPPEHPPLQKKDTR